MRGIIRKTCFYPNKHNNVIQTMYKNSIAHEKFHLHIIKNNRVPHSFTGRTEKRDRSTLHYTYYQYMKRSEKYNDPAIHVNSFRVMSLNTKTIFCYIISTRFQVFQDILHRLATLLSAQIFLSVFSSMILLSLYVIQYFVCLQIFFFFFFASFRIKHR